MKRSGSTFMEYVLILGVVSAVFIGMDTYIKRGIQGRLKEMTDFFIGREQVIEINPSGRTTVNTDTKSKVNAERVLGLGGSQEMRLQGITNITLTTQAEDFNVPAPPGSFMPAERGQVAPPPGPSQQQ